MIGVIMDLREASSILIDRYNYSDKKLKIVARALTPVADHPDAVKALAILEELLNTEPYRRLQFDLDLVRLYVAGIAKELEKEYDEKMSSAQFTFDS